MNSVVCAESVLRNQTGTEVDVRTAVMSILKYAKYRKGGSLSGSQTHTTSQPRQHSESAATSQMRQHSGSAATSHMRQHSELF